MGVATVSSKGQVTIPKAVREALRVDAGDRVLFVVREDGVVELRPATVNLLDLVGILVPSDKRHVSVDAMRAAVEHGAAESLLRAVRK